jgi:hypothetical protein
MTDSDDVERRPRFRPAEVVSEAEAEAAFASHDADRIHYALIDGSRCLDNDFVYPHAVGFLNHTDARVRDGAAFAMSMCRGSIVDRLKGDWEPIHRLDHLACSDPDESVRHMAVQALVDFLSACIPDD